MTDAELLERFRAIELTTEQLDHRTHVKLGYLLLLEHDFATAMTTIRDNLQQHMAKLDLPDGPLEGYNETTTQAFLHLIDITMTEYGNTFPVESADAFCDTHPQLLTKHALRLFYSPERRMHPEAKMQFIEPDLAPLPKRHGN